MSTAVGTKTRYTPEDLLTMPDGKRYELVGGQLVERQLGAISSLVGGRLYLELGRFCKENQLGIVWPADNGYQCFPHDPGLVRRPDVSFIRHARLPEDELPDGWVKIPPDLVVEIVSPNDSFDVLEEKLEDYERAGVPLIWVVSIKSRRVIVTRADGSVSRLREDDNLSGEDVIPGFRCLIRNILPPRQQPSAPVASPRAPEGPLRVSPPKPRSARPGAKRAKKEARKQRNNLS
jgi:Uma2 family endonuclease